MARPNDLVQGTLDLLILKTLSLEPKHVWAIAKRISPNPGRRAANPARLGVPGFASSGTKSRDQGQIEGNRNGRQAKFYSFAAAGRAHLEKEAENWNRLSAAINLVVETT